MDYHVVDRQMGLPPEDLTAFFNDIGAGGWWLVDNYSVQYEMRRSVFKQVGGVVEYLVDDRETGGTIQQIEDRLDFFGADGWELVTIDLVVQNKRRAIYARGGNGGGQGGGGIEEAPQDGKTYGRLNATWDWAVSHTNDVLDGGNF